MGRKKGIHITASHIPGDKNIEADRESRKLFVDLEWMLYFKSLSKAVMLLNYTANVDLLSSNANHSNFILAILAIQTLKPLVLIH